VSRDPFALQSLDSLASAAELGLTDLALQGRNETRIPRLATPRAPR
jgi:hypothetical protein